MRRFILTAAACAALMLGAVGVVHATPPPAPPGQGECDHGNSLKSCKPDPQPSHGADCDPHGNNGGINEDHCSSPAPEVTPSATPSASSTPSTQPSSKPSPSASGEPTPTATASPSPTPKPTPSASPSASPSSPTPAPSASPAPSRKPSAKPSTEPTAPPTDVEVR